MHRKSIAGATAAAVLGLMAAGCGGTSSRLPVASVANRGCGAPHCLAPATASEAISATKAARCMRAHGVPKFPDPNSQPGILKGHFGFTADSGIDPDTPQFKAAYLYCGARYLGLHRPSPAEMAQSNADAVKFSACMRSHGATDFPDPDGQGAIRVPSDTYMDSPKAQQAERACKSLETGKKFVLSIPIPVR